METGFVYVVQMEGHPTYKVGYSADVPPRRMSEIGIQLPFPYRLQFAHRVNNPRTIEHNIHRAFRCVRQNGEWFNLQPSQLHEIKLRLLALQTHELTERVVAAFKVEAALPIPARLEAYGRVFERLARRLNRRVAALERVRHGEQLIKAEAIQ